MRGQRGHAEGCMEDKWTCLAQAAMCRAVSWQRARSPDAHLLVQGQGSCPRKNASRKVVLQLGDCPGICRFNAVHSSRIRNSLHTKLHGCDRRRSVHAGRQTWTNSTHLHWPGTFNGLRDLFRTIRVMSQPCDLTPMVTLGMMQQLQMHGSRA